MLTDKYTSRRYDVQHAVNRVLNDLAALLEPEAMTVEAWYNDRGGISAHVKAGYPAS